MSIASTLRRSAFTILALLLVLLAGAWTLVPVTGADAASLAFAILAVAVTTAAWSSGVWRLEAGFPRHALVTVAGLAGVGLALRALLALFG